MRIVTGREIYEIEEAAGRKGVSRAVLMENAGRAVAGELRTIYPDLKKRKICIVCGKGNNGGDGLVAARYLYKEGVAPDVFLLGKRDELSKLSRANLSRLKKLKLNPGVITTPKGAGKLGSYEIIVDAIFGTGIRGNITGLSGKAVKSINASMAEVVSIDLPSGLNADNGRVSMPCVDADYTFTLGLPKVGLFLYPGSKYTGRISVLDIGISGDVIGKGRLSLSTSEGISQLLPRRKIDSHKGSYGHVFILAGSAGMTGAAALTSMGALRSGAGIVTLGIPSSLNSILEIKLTEVMTLPLSETRNKSLGLGAFGEISRFSKKVDVLAIGPGLSRVAETSRLVSKLISNIDLPVVIDADGIYALKGKGEVLKKRIAPTILTPHPGEMSYLLSCPTEKVQSARVEVARDFAMRQKVIIVLKGYHTVIASPGGEVWINPSGNPGMASGGMGDVLTGIIASLIGQGMDPMDACRAGVFLHGWAGDIAGDEKGEIGLVASDILEELPGAFKVIKKKKKM